MKTKVGAHLSDSKAIWVPDPCLGLSLKQKQGRLKRLFVKTMPLDTLSPLEGWLVSPETMLSAHVHNYV
jgi:hypothetical protein